MSHMSDWKGDADCIPRVSMDLLSGTYTNSVVAVEAVTLSTRLVQTFTTRTALTETQKKTKPRIMSNSK